MPAPVCSCLLYTSTTLTYHNAEGGTDHLNEGSEKIDEKIEEAIDWVSFKNQFFSAIIVAKDNFEKDAFMTSIPQEKGSGLSLIHIWHHLDGFAEIIATTLLVDDCLVDTTSGERIRFCSLNTGERCV